MKRNQVYHLLQWTIYIIIIIIVLFFIPVRYTWILLAVTGTAFTGAFILRVIKRYPGESEPSYIDLLTGIVAFLMIIPYQFIEEPDLVTFVRVMTPFIILLPHFVYILRNSSIHPPGIVVLGRKIKKGGKSKK